MSVIGSNILAGASGQGGGYNLTKSLRFRSSASAYLNRTPASAGNRRTWTWSGWVKRGALGVYSPLFIAGTTNGQQVGSLAFSSAGGVYDKLELNFGVQGTSTEFWLQTTQVFRDPSAWYHIVCAVDTTQATSSNRVKFYVNGAQVTALSSYGGYNQYPSPSYDTSVNNTVQHLVSRDAVNTAGYFDGYLTEVNFIDGQALTPSSFGETSTSTGVWIPKKYTGTYGTNGFYLDFEDTSSTAALGYDAAGSNDWTVNGISLTTGSTYDSMTDVPTLTNNTAGNYCVLNPLDKGTNNTLSNGNLSYAITTSTQGIVRATFGLPSTGKWYCEATKIAAGNLAAGIATRDAAFGNYLGGDVYGWGYFSADGKVYNNNVAVATGATLADGDILGIAFDSDNGTLQFYKNGTLQTTTTGFTPSTVQYFFAAGSFGGDGDFNFGQQPFAHTPPSGFVALNTFNLPTPTIGATASTTANKHFDIIKYTGDGAQTRSLTGLSFQPDFTWMKSRSITQEHQLYDIVRGAGGGKMLCSNRTAEEGQDGSGNSDSQYGYLSSFDSSGFSVNDGSVATTGGWVNSSAIPYVAWNWKAGNSAGSSNTAGTITSTVSANTSAGFSIVTYTGNGANSTVGHGLGVAPSMVTVKCRSTAGESWHTYHVGLSSLANTVYLNGTAAQGSFPTCFNSMSTLNSTVFSLGTDGASNGSGRTYVAYCFAEVAGYSAFGSYTGNGSTDGTFVYTGFRPRFILVKNSSNAGYSWLIWDSVRETYNVEGSPLFPNLSNAEGSVDVTNYGIDFVSNGFKIRATGAAVNNSGHTYIYMAFAETPQKFALGR